MNLDLDVDLDLDVVLDDLLRVYVQVQASPAVTLIELPLASVLAALTGKE